MEDILSSKAATFLDQQSTLMNRIAAIHVAYHSCESQILWCAQLMHSLPGLTDALAEKCGTPTGGLVCKTYYLTFLMVSMWLVKTNNHCIWSFNLWCLSAA